MADVEADRGILRGGRETAPAAGSDGLVAFMPYNLEPLYASAGDPKKLSLPNLAKPIPISHAHSYGINRAYLTAKDGSSRSRSRADHERAPRSRGALQTKTASPERNGSRRSLSGRTIAARAAHPGHVTGRAHTQRGGRNAGRPQEAAD